MSSVVLKAGSIQAPAAKLIRGQCWHEGLSKCKRHWPPGIDGHPIVRLRLDRP